MPGWVASYLTSSVHDNFILCSALVARHSPLSLSTLAPFLIRIDRRQVPDRGEVSSSLSQLLCAFVAFLVGSGTKVRSSGE